MAFYKIKIVLMHAITTKGGECEKKLSRFISTISLISNENLYGKSYRRQNSDVFTNGVIIEVLRFFS